MRATPSGWMCALNACAIGLLLAAALLPAAPGFAQERREGRDREGFRPYRTPHMVFDNRYHHGHYYPVTGYSVTVLPAGYLTVSYGSRRFMFHGGVWFEPVGARFVVVRPPVGVVVPVLPPAYTTVWAGRVPYYYANEVYYATAPGGYAVVNPSVEVATNAGVPPPPAAPGPASVQPAAPQAAAGVWYYCESSRTYYPYVSECREGWREVPATPPQPR